MSQEFHWIKKHFVDPQTTNRSEVTLGSGDDCAILNIPAGFELAISTDTLVGGVHFLMDTPAADIGHKMLAVNLSDLAAMGATPLAVSVAATFPSDTSESFVSELATGFFALSHQHDLQIIGGDLTSGPLSFSLNIYGLLPQGKALKRSGAKVGDLIVVSGELGDAAAALKFPEPALLERSRRPTPRVELGQQLLNHASSCLDISDGLTQDLSHLLKASGVGAKLDLSVIPVSDDLLKTVDSEQALQYALHGGDDYELCFTISTDELAALGLENVTVIGEVIAGSGIVDLQGNAVQVKGWQHF